MNILGFQMIVKDKVFHSSSIIIHTYCHLEIASCFCGRNLFSSLHGARGIAEFILTELTENALGYICQCRVLHLVRLVVLLGNVIFPFIRAYQDKQHSKLPGAVSAEAFQQHQLVVRSLFHPHSSLPDDNPSHTYPTLPNCTYLGQACKDQEVPGPSHGHLEAAVCFRKMRSRVVPASQTSLPGGFGNLALHRRWWDST